MTQRLYGGRWKIAPNAPPLGDGGQSTVFRVVDQRGEYQGQFALKRVKTRHGTSDFVMKSKRLSVCVIPTSFSCSITPPLMTTLRDSSS